MYFEDIEKEVKSQHDFISEQIEILKKMKDDYNYLIEYKNVLSKAASILGGKRVESEDSMSLDNSNDSVSIHKSLMDAHEITIGHVAGTILREEQERFHKMIFRVTRGNAIVTFKEFTKPVIDYFGKRQMKTVYVIIFQEGEFIREKIIRICDSFMGQRFEIPYGGFTGKLRELELKIRDAKKLFSVNSKIRTFLSKTNTVENEESSALIIHEWYTIKERAIFSTLDR